MKRIAIVGAGWMARTRARALLASGQVSICAVASRHLATAQAFAAEIGCATCFDDYRQLITVQPDALLVEVPHSAQDEIVFWALEHRLPLLIGGVLAANTANAQRILELSQRSRLVVEAGFEARYSAPWIAAKAMLDSGQLGDLVAIRSIALWGGDPNTWYYRQRDSGGMPLTHMTYCFINPIRWLVGNPHAVSAFANRKLHTAPGLVAEETCIANLLFEGDVLGSLTAGFVKPGNIPSWTATFIGTRAAVELFPTENGVGHLLLYHADQCERRTFESAGDPFEHQAAAFLAALDGGNECRNTPADTIDDIRIAEAIVASATQRRTILL
jgi:myo-inositol 2-dehydrogenase/D-chiro-inositol 1-dehydrogenase